MGKFGCFWLPFTRSQPEANISTLVAPRFFPWLCHGSSEQLCCFWLKVKTATRQWANSFSTCHAGQKSLNFEGSRLGQQTDRQVLHGLIFGKPSGDVVGGEEAPLKRQVVHDSTAIGLDL